MFVVEVFLFLFFHIMQVQVYRLFVYTYILFFFLSRPRAGAFGAAGRALAQASPRQLQARFVAQYCLQHGGVRQEPGVQCCNGGYVHRATVARGVIPDHHSERTQDRNGAKHLIGYLLVGGAGEGGKGKEGFFYFRKMKQRCRPSVCRVE